MVACLSRSGGFSPIFPGSASSLKTMQMEDHSSEIANRATASVLKRTLSADEMCSKKSGGEIKKSSSVENLDNMISGEDGNGSGSWSKASGEEKSEKMKTTDLWEALLSKKDDVAPYVHPMAKKSASSLSKKSLEICTEPLGSETGADTFTFLEASDKELIGNDVVALTTEADKKPVAEATVEAPPVTKSKRTAVTAASFPPPLPSLGDGNNVQMRFHRQGGRLVMEAVSVPSRNCFKAERQGGRLLLTFSDESSDEEEEEAAMADPVEEDSGDGKGGNKILFLTGRMNTRDDSVAKTWTPAPSELILATVNPYVWSRKMVTRGGSATVAQVNRDGYYGKIQEGLLT